MHRGNWGGIPNPIQFENTDRQRLSTKPGLGMSPVPLGLRWHCRGQAGFRALGTKAGVKVEALIESVLSLLPDFASLCWTSRDLAAWSSLSRLLFLHP